MIVLTVATQDLASLYPGWRMRIYHNVTSAQPAALASLCSLYCGHQHVDLPVDGGCPGWGTSTRSSRWGGSGGSR